jgi:hypothetical protein
MNESGKSDKPIVPMKSTNGGSRQNFWEFVDQLERVEGRDLAKENEDHSGNSTGAVFHVDPAKQTDRTQSRLPIRAIGRDDPRQEPGAVVPLAGICAGGGGQAPSLPRRSIIKFPVLSLAVLASASLGAGWLGEDCAPSPGVGPFPRSIAPRPRGMTRGGCWINPILLLKFNRRRPRRCHARIRMRWLHWELVRRVETSLAR